MDKYSVVMKEDPELDLPFNGAECGVPVKKEEDENTGDWTVLDGHKDASPDGEDAAGYSEVTGKEDDLLYTSPRTSRTSGSSSQSHTPKAHNSGGKIFHCLECGKSFNRSSRLITHSRTHSGEKPFSCLECGMSFSQSSNLKVHSRTHTGEKPFHCLECGMSFSRSTHLISHSRTHSREKPFPCLECGKNFSQSSALKIHSRTHSREKPFHCLDCGKSFSTSSNLKVHSSTHKKALIKPFHCLGSELKKSFRQFPILNKHRNTHTRQNLFQCLYCGEGFGRRRHLQEHISQNCGLTDPLSLA